MEEDARIPRCSARAVQAAHGCTEADDDANVDSDIPQVTYAKKSKRRLAAEAVAAAEAAANPSAAPNPEAPAGFVLDPNTGYYYNSTTGQYYEPKTRTYCCFNEGQWYYYDSGAKEYKPWVQQQPTEGEAQSAAAEPPAEGAADEPKSEEVIKPVDSATGAALVQELLQQAKTAVVQRPLSPTHPSNVPKPQAYLGVFDTGQM